MMPLPLRSIPAVRRLAWCVSAVVAVTSVCETARAELPEGCVSLGEALTGHSCFHVQYGPTKTVSATPGEVATGSTPVVDAVHTEFRVSLPAQSGHAVVTYSPTRSGSWAIFTGSLVPLEVRDETQQSRPVELVQEGNTGCDALPFVRVFELTSGERYTFVFGPSAETEVRLVVEYVDDFVTDNGRDEDGDGYGDGSDVIVTSCAPPKGYASNALDCDDQDASVNPGAEELCDGVDQNCNGVPDDVGLTCRVGVGACVSQGVWACPAPGAKAMCDATPAAPTAEQCNNVDDDCDGSVDEGDALCASADAPVCVREGSHAACGCALDADCGTADSGRVCDTGTRRCREGCSKAPGRNGCPEGQRCTGGDDGSVGVCDPGDGGSVSPETQGGCACSFTRAPSAMAGSLCALLLTAALVGRRRRRLSKIAGAISVAAHIPGCGPTVAVADGQGGESGCLPMLGAALGEHACSHGTHGPFKDVVATSTPVEAPSTDEIHVSYFVDLPAQGTQRGFVTYRPSREGDHVFFTNLDIPISLETDDGSAVEVTPIGWESNCGSLSHARRIHVEKGRPYRVAIGPASSSPVLVFIEHLGTFGEDAVSGGCD